MCPPSLLDPGQVLKGAYDEPDQALRVNVVTGTISATNPSVSPNGAAIPGQSTLVAGENNSGNQEPLQTDASGNLKVNVVAGTISAENPSVSTTGSAVPAYATFAGAKLGANLVGLTATINGLIVDGSAVTQPISAVALPLPTGASTAANQTSANTSLSSLDSKTVHVDTGAVVVSSSALPSGASTSALQTSGNSSLTSIAASVAGTLAVSAASLPLPSGASTSALQTAGNASLASIDTKLTNPLPVSVASLPLPSGAATSANQTTANTSLASIDSKLTSPLAVTGTFFQATQPVSGTVNAKAATPTALTITQAALAVGTSAVRLTVSGSAPAATRVSLVATPDRASTANFYIGSSSVTNSGATRGIEIAAGQTFIANSDAGDYFIVSDTVGQIVEVLEQA